MRTTKSSVSSPIYHILPSATALTCCYFESALSIFFFLMRPRPPRSTLFPYTTLFRSDRANRYRAARNVRVRAHLFRDAKGALEQTMQIGTDCAGCSGRFVCFFRLPQYLALADNHRVERGGDPEKVVHAFFSLVPVKWRRVVMRIGIHFAHEATRNFIGGNALLRNSVNLHPIARAQQQRFGATGFAHDRFSRCAARELLARCHGRCVMA